MKDCKSLCVAVRFVPPWLTSTNTEKVAINDVYLFVYMQAPEQWGTGPRAPPLFLNGGHGGTDSAVKLSRIQLSSARISGGTWKGPTPLVLRRAPLEAIKMGLEGTGFRPSSLVCKSSVFSAYYCPNEIQWLPNYWDCKFQCTPLQSRYCIVWDTVYSLL